jgi:hypothetical protein
VNERWKAIRDQAPIKQCNPKVTKRQLEIEYLHALSALLERMVSYQNAGVMFEMADYASRNSDLVDPELL